MKNLLSDLDAKAGKTPYQVYTVKHGIESIEALVPLSNAVAFEARVASTNLPTRQSVIEVITEHGGRLK